MSQALTVSVPSVALIEGRPATSSVAIAEHFGKTHAKVLRDIDHLIENCPKEFHEANFGFMYRDVEIGNGATRQERFYNVYFDGFMLLVMGYTGKKALTMKLAYIEAFNAMRAQLEGERQPVTIRHELADAPITPDQQCTLRALVKARIETIPEGQRPKGLYPQVWSRFNNHFRIARYCQLPQCRMSEAIEYLTQMDLMPTALPQGNSSEIPNSTLSGLPVPVDAPKQLKVLHNARQICHFDFLPQAYSASDREAAERHHLANDLYKLQDCLWAALYNVCSAAAKLRT